MQIYDFASALGFKQFAKQQPENIRPSSSDGSSKKEPFSVLFEWTQKVPASKKFDKKAIRNLIVISVVLGAFAIAVQEFLLVLTISLMLFVYYLLTKRNQEEIFFQVTNYGIKVDQRLYEWHELNRFFVSPEGFICIDTKILLPSRLYIYTLPTNHQEVISILENYVMKLEVIPTTFVDGIIASIQDKVDFNQPSK